MGVVYLYNTGFSTRPWVSLYTFFVHSFQHILISLLRSFSTRVLNVLNNFNMALFIYGSIKLQFDEGFRATMTGPVSKVCEGIISRELFETSLPTSRMQAMAHKRT